MKPNQQQQLQLQAYLAKNLRYRETYAEFYDHILSALETQPNSVSFDNASREIIAKDFGGVEGMRLIEQNYQRSVFVEMRKKYFRYAVENLKFPWVILLVVFTISMYNIFKQPWFTFMEFLIVLMSIRAIPFFLQLARQINADYAAGAPKTSIKSGFFKWLNKSPAMLILILLLVAPNSFKDGITARAMLNPVFMTALCVAITFHSFNFYKVYRDDIRTSFKPANF